MGDRKQEDIIRSEALASAGWSVIRFWGSEINRDVDYCVDRIIDAINAERHKRQELGTIYT